MANIFEIPGWKTKQVNSESYHYLYVKPTSGEKKTFVFLHGAPTGALAFRKIVPLVIGEGNGAIVVELLGFGGSSRPKEVEKYSPLAISSAVVDILTTEGVGKAIVVGQGWGVSIGTRLALKYPQHVEGLVQVAIPFLPLEAKPLDVQGLNAMFKPLIGYDPLGYMPFMASDGALKLLSEHTESFVRLLYDDSTNLASARTFYDTGALENSLKADLKPPTPSWVTEQASSGYCTSYIEMQEILDFVKRQDMDATLQYYRFSMFHFDKEDGDLPKRLSTPYLYIECKGDPMIPPPIVQAQLAHCDKIAIKTFNAGHWVMEEEPVNVVNAVKEWLAAALV
ncbi:alpha/beta-hydrolase [Clavulina sp. PMI_390]|nr:alpha/beta-hydrolase [Clavulina sp. PMI_390]